ncbi:hypothetical protein [Flammeovirga sp. OC4]|uniref:hypothetical protein n=1 Tax=Flammeovirga sp. OC4 TaxID=1382345 RepID=UPI0005C4E013|nr:hypothetical protein [Flammeovirga sp. OC4]
MLQIYNAIKDRLKECESKFKVQGLSPVMHIDYDKGQYLRPQDFEIFPMPAVFYTYNITWQDRPGKTQLGTATIDLKIVIPTSSSIAMNSATLSEAEKVLRYHLTVHSCIHGLKSPSVSGLRRTQESDDPSPIGLHIHTISYTCEVTDNSTHLLADYVDAQVDDLVIQGRIGAKNFQI